MNFIGEQLYFVKRYNGKGKFVATDNICELAEYVARWESAGDIITSVVEINIDGSRPRVAIKKLDAYKKVVKRIRKESKYDCL